jgi:acyl-CoA hydrolase
MDSNSTRTSPPSESERSTRVDQKKCADWRAAYADRVKSAEKAMQLVCRGHRVFIGSGCGEPQHLVRALEQVAIELADLEVLHLLSLGRTSYTDEAFRDKVRLK